MRIRELREAAGLTQTALALRVGVSKQAVSQWEFGTTWPSAELLPRIAFALGCRIGDLYEEEVQNGPREAAEEKILRCAQDDNGNGPPGTSAPTD